MQASKSRDLLLRKIWHACFVHWISRYSKSKWSTYADNLSNTWQGPWIEGVDQNNDCTQRWGASVNRTIASVLELLYPFFFRRHNSLAQHSKSSPRFSWVKWFQTQSLLKGATDALFCCLSVYTTLETRVCFIWNTSDCQTDCSQWCWKISSCWTSLRENLCWRFWTMLSCPLGIYCTALCNGDLDVCIDTSMLKLYLHRTRSACNQMVSPKIANCDICRLSWRRS